MASSVELFTGCGGLAMGLSHAGFTSQKMVEWDRHSVANVNHNRTRKIDHVADWPIMLADVRSIDWSLFKGVDLVAGGPPCQPFSVGGRHMGQNDRRDMWPEAIRAVREIRPRGFLFENVRGLVRDAFAEYLRWIVTALGNPDIDFDAISKWESSVEQPKLARGPEYRVRIVKVNAADFGAAQKRHRVIVMGLRSDFGEEPPTLVATHSRERLLWDQWITGDYWARHGMKRPVQGPDSLDAAIVRRLVDKNVEPPGLAWRTVRDAIHGLGDPGSGFVANHVAQLGARAYPGHTGSILDMPSKALKAGVHGVPGGENMIVLSNGAVRYLTIREAARLQGLPDDYEFVGSWSENMRQLGNAVPTELARAAAAALRKAIENPSDANASLNNTRAA